MRGGWVGAGWVGGWMGTVAHAFGELVHVCLGGGMGGWRRGGGSLGGTAWRVGCCAVGWGGVVFGRLVVVVGG